MSPSEFEDSYEDVKKIEGLILSETIDALGPSPVMCVGPGATVLDAIRIMNARRVGCVCVAKDGALLGIFTERDVLRKIVEQGLDVESTPVTTVMTRDPETLTRHDRIAFALNKMTVGGFRHIPLVRADGKLDAIISIRDIAEFLVGLFPARVLNLPPSPAHEAPGDADGG